MYATCPQCASETFGRIARVDGLEVPGSPTYRCHACGAEWHDMAEHPEAKGYVPELHDDLWLCGACGGDRSDWDAGRHETVLCLCCAIHVTGGAMLCGACGEHAEPSGIDRHEAELFGRRRLRMNVRRLGLPFDEDVHLWTYLSAVGLHGPSVVDDFVERFG